MSTNLEAALEAEGIQILGYGETSKGKPTIIVACPGANLHSKENNQRDCWVVDDGGAPYLYCFHESCLNVREVKTSALARRTSGSTWTPLQTRRKPDSRPVPAAPEPPSGATDDEAFAQFERQVASLFRSGETFAICAPNPKPTKPEFYVVGECDLRAVFDGLTAQEAKAKCGVYISTNPFKTGTRTPKDSEVAAFRHVLVESDACSMAEQWEALHKSGLPIASLVWSGGKSLHGLVRVDAATAAEHSDRFATCVGKLKELGLKADSQNKNAARWTRAAGFARTEKGGFQTGFGPADGAHPTWAAFEEAEACKGGVEAMVSIPEAPPETPFPIHALPPEARGMISEVARVSFANPNLVAVQSLGWLSAAIGKGAVSVSGSMRTFPNLFILGISETGSGKSESAKHLGAPLYRLIEGEVRLWSSDVFPKAQARLREINLLQKAIDKRARENEGAFPEADRKVMEALIAEKGELEGKLKPPKFNAEDITQEALADALRSFDESLLLYSTDAGKVLSNLLGRYSSTSDGKTLREDTLFLKGYSVEPTIVDRVNRTTTLTEPCLTMLWLIQPGKIPLLFGDEGLCDGGLMPRIMPCLTPRGLPERSFQEPINEDAQWEWNRLIDGLFRLRRAGGGVQSGSRTEFQVAEDAARMWLEWDNQNRVKTKTTGILDDVSGFVSRWGEWAQRVAVILQATKFIEGDKDRTISKETLAEAIEIAQWFSNEQLRILHAGRIAAREAEFDRTKQRAGKLEELLKDAQREKSLADLGRRNAFTEQEVRSLAVRFPEKFEVREKPTATKPSIVCVLK